MDRFNGIIGKSAKMREIYQLIDIAAKNNIIVLLQGETGTGKELIAQAIHKRSNRVKGPFIPMNCAAIPHDLAESELFGHEKGAFTSAIKERQGKLELAHGGTILFDEIGEMNLFLQSKLLRVVEDKLVYRIGSNKPIKVDIRIIAATNKPLSLQVKEGKFRDDLYYRLSVFQINLPPLRERKEDIPDLVNHFIDMANKEFNKNITSITNKALNKLMDYDWPGNVREIKNCIAKAVIIANGSVITPNDIQLSPVPIIDEKPKTQITNLYTNTKKEKQPSLIDLEIMAIKRMLQEKNGNKKETAKALGIGRSSLYWKIKRYNLA
jgi:transcriptional regulator with PAS, ATPase and Fis domain